MATRFEIVLHGPRPEALRAAAEDALDEIARVEQWLSPYLPASSLARIHRAAHLRPVPVEPPVFAFLATVAGLVHATDGAFDPTVGPLLRAWGFHGGEPFLPNPSAIPDALARVGWRHVRLEPATHSVRLLLPGVEIHPGAVGKGWALDRATEILRESGVESALLHGGTSSVVAIGAPPGQPAWRVALPCKPSGPDAALETSAVVDLKDETLSVSAAWGRSQQGPAHVLDPRTGQPVASGTMAAVVLPSAAASDAWSTALLVDPKTIAPRLARLHPGARLWTA
jgi:thiamine biosynthesis lipoprotein